MTERNNREPSFSLHEFRSWLAKQGQPKMRKKKAKTKLQEAMIGKMVEPRLGLTRLEQKIAESNKTEVADILADDFKTNGGKITEVNELMVRIEVGSGSFLIPKIYTKDMEVG
jgi:hypothetical protein